MQLQIWIPGLILLSYVVPTLEGQQGVTITGRVWDGDRPVAGATVEVTNKITRERFTRQTDEDGRYEVTDLPTNTMFDIAITVPGSRTGSIRDVRTDHTGIAPVDVDFSQQTISGPPAGRKVGRGAACQVCVDGGTLLSGDVSRSPRLTGREFLILSDNEAPGYGLYSYPLFGSPPGDGEKERYESAIRAFLQVFVDIKEYKIPRQRLNITYLPVKRPVTPGRAVDQIVNEDYNYARAAELLTSVTEGIRTSGPYLVSARRPLSASSVDSTLRCKNPSVVLRQDLSSFPPSLILAAVKIFMEKAGQDTEWGTTTLPDFVLDLRKYIELAAISLPYVKDSARDWKSFLASVIGFKDPGQSAKTTN